MDATIDVGGAVVRTPRFPHTEDLRMPGRMTVAMTAAFDHYLRTAASATVTTTMPRHLLHWGRFSRDVRSLPFYADLAEEPDVHARVFPASDRQPEVEVVSREPLRWRWLPGTVEVLRAPSTYTPLNPAVRTAYADHEPNRSAWAQHWCHGDGPRPTVLVIHGFMASAYWLNRLFFSLPWWYANGYDLLLVTLPFHGQRSKDRVMSGSGLFTHGPSTLIEGLLQGTADLRMWMDHLEAQGVEQIGATGVSLGGYMTSLLAAADPRLHFAIPNVPVTDLADGMRSWKPSGSITNLLHERLGMREGDVEAALRVASPLFHEVLLPRERLFVIAGLGDRLAPPEHAERLWEHWGRPAVHAFPGNHMLHVERGDYLHRMGRFIRSTGFGA
jgi:pimeloyl-ACP methyl ester carboxylesterase